METKKINLMGFFTLTAAMLMSADEYPAFAQSGLLSVLYLIFAGIIWFLPVALCSAELATIDGNEDGGVFTWVKNILGSRFGFMAVFFQWLQITVNFITMIYFIIGAISYVFNWPELNDNPIIKWIAFLVIYWGMTFWQLGGVGKTEKLVNVSFYSGIVFPSIVLLILGLVYFFSAGHVQFDTNVSSNLATLKQNFSLDTIVPYVLAFTGIEASASYINNLERPKRNYPIALLTLVVFAILIDSLGGLSVAAVVPVKDLTLNQGVIQAVSQMFNDTIPFLGWGVYIIGLLMAFGMIGEISSWIIGPVKSLFVTAEDGILPRYFMQVNKKNVPVRLIFLQGGIVTIISGVLTVIFGGDNNAYQMAMALTVMLYLVTYVLIFTAYLKQINQKDKVHRDFVIPGGKMGQYGIASIGLLSSIIVFYSTFIPNQHITGIKSGTYTMIMVIFFAVIVIITELTYEIGSRVPDVGGYNWTVKRSDINKIQKSIYPKGRVQHDIKLIEKDVEKKESQVNNFIDNHESR
ncbi:amino acid permease [Pediococcus claussenii]|uniref:Glutamate/gamma-aminobutyrate antiporter n=1 Tax=Pediococcus claussenii (strain ATCC BAA-344 / DSM 14800 / JCM 18046 / KCTC 3811 / LMG 21948 / P06) TaxID=701521 RepID=G8PDU9_PEDCP|nr:amino acid permease [Pediococcus claussenii]AEV95434.1 glutamate/gamma-aminobutyrate antiporter [Pediococcus claussenii ATCC BAA-344]ANZ68963.1 antiporter [Pediococcus claussenii]ANZ70779.1 antiporter [Pediococcus claussenii]KRN19076.1 gadC protein [Pediococcus claussenii]